MTRTGLLVAAVLTILVGTACDRGDSDDSVEVRSHPEPVVNMADATFAVDGAALHVADATCFLEREELSGGSAIVARIEVSATSEDTTYPATLIVSDAPGGTQHDVIVSAMPDGAIEGVNYGSRVLIDDGGATIEREGDVFAVDSTFPSLPQGNEADPIAVSLRVDCAGG